MSGPVHDRQTILVRRPSRQLADGEVTHIDRMPVDIDLALEQWANYVAVFVDAGWDVIELDPMEHHPDGVFVEDVVVMYGQLAVVTRPGAAARLGEITGLDDRLAELGYDVARIEAPGTLDGGDVMKIGSTMYVGLGGRTNEPGIAQLAALVEPLGGAVVPVPMTTALHLKSAVTALPDGTVIGFEPIVDDPTLFESFVAAPEEPGAHVVDLGDDRLIMTARADRTRQMLEARGYDVVVSDISEFEKLEGCVTCLSVRLRTAP